MSSWAGSAASTVGCLSWRVTSLCTGQIVSCFGRELPVSKSIMTRAMYVVIFFVTGAIAFASRMWLPALLKYANVLKYVPSLEIYHVDDDYTMGAFAAYRVCFALFLMHLLLAIVLMFVRTSKDIRAPIQDSWWSIKILFLVAVSVSTFFIPYSNVFFVVFSWIGMVLSFLFVLIQLFLLIGVAYAWGEAVIEKSGDSKKWSAVLVMATLFLYGAIAVITVVLFVFYALRPMCWFNAVFPLINLMVGLAISAVSIVPTVQAAHPRGVGLFQSGIVMLYCTYYIWSAVMSEPESTGCNVFYAGASWISLLTGSLVTLCAVCFMTLRSASKTSSVAAMATSPLLDTPAEVAYQGVKTGSDDESTADQEAGESTETSAKKAKSTNSDDDDEKDEVAYSYSVFHLIFVLGVCYMMMLVTDWQTLHIDGVRNNNYRMDSGYPSFVLKIVTSWAAYALYLWSLMAPCLLPGREFA